jgi:hypothetical protein
VVEEEPTVTSGDETGTIRITNGRTLPPSWTTGKEVYLNSVGTLPLPLDEYTPYYVIRVSDTTFSLSETPDGAIAGAALEINNNPVNLSFVGSIERTFKALSGKTTKTNWRRHDADTRYTISLTAGMAVSGVQQMVKIQIK